MIDVVVDPYFTHLWAPSEWLGMYSDKSLCPGTWAKLTCWDPSRKYPGQNDQLSKLDSLFWWSECCNQLQMHSEPASSQKRSPGWWTQNQNISVAPPQPHCTVTACFGCPNHTPLHYSACPPSSSSTHYAYPYPLCSLHLSTHLPSHHSNGRGAYHAYSFIVNSTASSEFIWSTSNQFLAPNPRGHCWNLGPELFRHAVLLDYEHSGRNCFGSLSRTAIYSSASALFRIWRCRRLLF